jgi:radical SAM superfamily enzyme with C-terminal helix-hairpin-helix motif
MNGLARLVRRVVLAPSEWVASGEVKVKGWATHPRRCRVSIETYRGCERPMSCMLSGCSVQMKPL